MIAKIAVSAANFAIDKPYSYAVPQTMALQPGHRVMVPFGRSNRHTEGVVLSLEEGAAEGLKAVENCLDETSLVSPYQLRMAAFVRENRLGLVVESIDEIPRAIAAITAEEYAEMAASARAWGNKLRQGDMTRAAIEALG